MIEFEWNKFLSREFLVGCALIVVASVALLRSGLPPRPSGKSRRSRPGMGREWRHLVQATGVWSRSCCVLDAPFRFVWERDVHAVAPPATA